MSLTKENELIKKSRAWIEIDLKNLQNNILEIQKNMAKNTKIMAVVKANAYGHGDVEIAKYLNTLKIFDFAVATLKEGITLRKNGVKGNILILGYTHIDAIPLVIKYNLIQTITEEEYARRLMQLPDRRKLRVHIKINTGMNRIGINPIHLDLIKEIYESKNLVVEGIFTHLAVSDSKNSDDIDFTKKQLRTFDELINTLKNINIQVGKVHALASYGFLNYPEWQYDYIRMGIIMYGVYSSKEDLPNTFLNLKPVLSLKARITSIREIQAGDSVSYGRTFKGIKPTKIASVSIGYADGLPRNLSNKNQIVKINDAYGIIIGRICMDQMIIDVSAVSDVHIGDVVEIISDDQNLSVEEMAANSNTITNEILSRLGSRLEIVVK